MVGLLVLLLAAAALRADVAVFADGRVRLPVIVAADAGPEERAAAEELARVLGAMSGLEWPVGTESEEGRCGPRRGGSPHGERGGPHRGDDAGFYVGHTQAATRELRPLRPAADLLAPKADEIGPDGFRVTTRDGRVFLEGATPEATANAVSWLLQHEGGVRWYAPGPLGEVIPRRKEWTLPELRVVREPAYVSREITGVDAAWARHNGLRQRFEYSHNLTRVFPPELTAAHPEWFPLVQGGRLLPVSKADFNWQPDLARPEVAEWAAQQAAEAFDRAPERASFSLGMNDSVRFDQGAGTRAAVEPLRYFRGMPDYSPLVFGFMNRAAEGLGRQTVGRARQPALGPAHADKYLGCLAYFWCENPPPFPVHPQVVPYVTTDRTQFYDAGYRAADYALMSRWGGSGVRAFGLWEYGYGHAYVVPRVPHAMLAEAVREGWRRGARGYIADTGPHWGFDAFKVWMLAQLLWEPERTTAELEDDFFRGWYGPAAEPMRRFFARCEAQWMAQEGPPWWIKFYRQQDQVLLFPPEVCRELRAILAEAEAAAGRAEGRRLKTESGSSGRPCLPDGTQGVPLRGEPIPKPETRNPKPETPFPARIALTSRAFAVTEAAVEFGRLRSALSAETETISAEELAPQLQQLQRARIALERAAGAAARTESAADRAGAAARTESAADRAGAAVDEGGLAAMATGDVAYLLRNDPVPRLLAALGRRDPNAPAEALLGLRIAGNPVPAHWADLAAAWGDGRFAGLKNRLANGDFPRVSAGRMEPDFLYPRWGELPADWTVRGIATENGRVALLPANAGRTTDNHLSPLRSETVRNNPSLASTDVELAAFPWVRSCHGEASRGPVGPRLGEAGCVPVSGVPTGTPRRTQPAGRTLRFEGAWETQLVATVPATPRRLNVVKARMRGHSSPGGDAALFLVFVTADGRSTGEYRTQTLPKGASEWRTQLLAATAPEDAAWVSIGVAALRQPAGDWLEVAEVELSELEK